MINIHASYKSLNIMSHLKQNYESKLKILHFAIQINLL